MAACRTRPTPILPLRLHRALLARGETVAAAESLTAGLFCATLATVPGASATLRGGVVVYATELKTALAGVPADLLAAHGPVSPETAAALADGVRERCAANWGIGLTGVAGPDPVDGHGPGRVYLGIAGAGGTDVVELDLPGDRAAVRAGAVAAAMDAPAGPAGLTGTRRPAAGVTPSADARRSVGPGAPDAAYRERTAPACGAAASPLAGQETAMTLLRTQLGNTLRGHRLRQRRTLRDVSGAARVSLGYLSEVERGQKEASSELLASICDALDVELADLLAEVSLELRGASGGAVRPLAPAADAPGRRDPAGRRAARRREPVAEPALALVGAPARSALRRGEAVSLAA